MKLRPFFLIVAGALALTACDRPKGAPAGYPSPVDLATATGAPAPPTIVTVYAPEPLPARDPEPITWDPVSSRFMLNGTVLNTAYIWRFDGGVDGFTAVGSKISSDPGGGLRVQQQGLDPVLRSPRTLSIEGRRYNAVLVRLTREKPGAKWDGSLFYTTPAHGETGEFHTKPARGANPVVGETTIMVYNMAAPKTGGDDWTTSIVSGLRLDLDDTADGAFLIRQIAVVSLPSPPPLAAPTTLRPAQ
jgi:hypothetical protein